MKKSTYKIASILVTILVVILANFSTVSSNNRFSEKDLWQYKKWTKVNKEPLKINDIVATLCASRFPIDKSPEKNPHRDKFITVYVNDIGKEAMFAKIPKFAIGSVIVKEKLPTPIDKAELMTVMIKREKGFNPESGDWEYLVLDPIKTTIIERGKLEHCQKCHLAQKDRDFIFRTYYYDYAPIKLTN
ncbi:MAG: cytochrome P460 family protein [Acidobacteria bacterium]|nr:cytochrome P460 family protein [Acidobacteriota bacterium]